MEVKYIEFSHRPRPSASGKTKIWDVLSYEDWELGEVKWHSRWRRYAFYPDRSDQTFFEQDCLRKIADFCEEQTAKLRKKWAKRRKARVCQEQ